ncbi:MAG: Dethiobiotin synthase [Bacteroidota bacterium]|jgi:dethiobiotin synthetase
MKFKGFIIAGIGTEIGKTIASSILVKALNFNYWKPVQSGNLEDSDTINVRKLVGQTEGEFFESSYNFINPLSPHTAAELENRKIELKNFILPESNRATIVELAGGIMVPLNDSETNLDLIKKLNLPVVLVSRNYLGSINHTLLSYEILKRENIQILGLIINGKENSSGEKFILNYTQLPIILRINEEEEFNTEKIEEYAGKVERILFQ